MTSETSDARAGRGVTRRREVVNGETFVEVSTASMSLRVRAPAAPPRCTSESLDATAVNMASAVSAGMRNGLALVAMDRWPQGGAETVLWQRDVRIGVAREETLAGMVGPRVFLRGGALTVGAWAQGQGATFVRVGRSGAAQAPDGLVRCLGGVRGLLEGPDGTLYVWHARALSEEGSPSVRLTRVRPDGSTDTTADIQHGAILGVIPHERGLILWRSPIMGHRSAVTTLQSLAPDLSLESDILVDEPIEGFDHRCPFFALESFENTLRGRLVCANGDTWVARPGSVSPDLAFGDNVVAYAGGATALVARVPQGARALVVEGFGGELARVPIEGVVLSSSLAVEGATVLLAWVEAADRDAPARRRRIVRLDCPQPL